MENTVVETVTETVVPVPEVAVTPVVAVPEAPGWFEKLIIKLHLDGLLKKINLTPGRLGQIMLYLGIGFLAGFLFKKYGKLFLIVILTIVGLFVLQHFGFVSIAINWEKIRALQPIPVMQGENVWSEYWAWLMANIAIVISSAIGFFIGFKVG